MWVVAIVINSFPSKITKFLKILDISKHVLTPSAHIQDVHFTRKILLHKFLTYHVLK